MEKRTGKKLMNYFNIYKTCRPKTRLGNPFGIEMTNLWLEIYEPVSLSSIDGLFYRHAHLTDGIIQISKSTLTRGLQDYLNELTRANFRECALECLKLNLNSN